MHTLQQLAPIPLRLATGIGLIRHGGIKLFVDGGHENIVYLLGQLGVPFAEPMGWVVGLVEFGGGIGMCLGVCFKLVTSINILNIGGLLVLGTLAGGIPAPLPGGDPLPEFREAILLGAGVLSLWLSGPGPYALSALLGSRLGASGSPSGSH